MASAPLVSVIITAYNVADYIGPAILSALAQTLGDFEVLVLDDGSTDGTLKTARAFFDRRLRIIQCPHRGPATLLRAGIELAQSPYIAPLDADDLWTPEKLEQQYQFLEAHRDAGLAFTWSRVIDEEGQDTGITSQLWEGPVAFSEMLSDCALGLNSAALIRRKTLLAAGGIDTSLSAHYDLDLALRIALLRHRNVWAIPEFLTMHRRRPGQLSSDIPAMEHAFHQVMVKARTLAPSLLARVEQEAQASMQRRFAYGWYSKRKYRRSLDAMARLFRHDPSAFSRDRRNWEMTAAALTAQVLPERLHTRWSLAALGPRRREFYGPPDERPERWL